MTTKEIWKPVVGLEGLYEVSNFGRVKTLRREGTAGGILKQQKNKGERGGYMAVNLCTKNVCLTKQVHRLVARAFIPNPKKRTLINHKNGIRSDNRVLNLEWVTAKENTWHSIRSGRFCMGSRRPQAKLDERKVAIIRMGYTGRHGQISSFARRYKVSVQVISEVVHGLAWR